MVTVYDGAGISWTFQVWSRVLKGYEELYTVIAAVRDVSVSTRREDSDGKTAIAESPQGPGAPANFIDQAPRECV